MIRASSLSTPWLARDLEAVVWDFNGTLIDDVDLVVRSVNAQLVKRGLPKLTVDRYRELFGFPVAHYYRLIGLDPSAESIEALSAEFHHAYAPGLIDCPLHDGVRCVVERFKEQAVHQFVLSAMEEGLLQRTIEEFGIADFFDAIYGLAHLKADSKISRGRELLAGHNIRPETALMIGDTDHDAEVADALGVPVVLVAQGHQSKARLHKMGCPVYRDMPALVGGLP